MLVVSGDPVQRPGRHGDNIKSHKMKVAAQILSSSVPASETLSESLLRAKQQWNSGENFNQNQIKMSAHTVKLLFFLLQGPFGRQNNHKVTQ